MKKIYNTEMPYERFEKFGVKALTDVELLAIILRTGSKKTNVLELSRLVLSEKGRSSSLLKLMNMSFEQLKDIDGIGKIKATQLLCIIEMVKRLWIYKNYEERISFASPKLVADYYIQDMRFLKKEELRLAFLDTRQQFISDITVSVGTVDASLVSVREVMIEALKHNAVNIVLIHNHPSGDPMPSKEDHKVTSAIDRACDLIGIKLNDHIIIGDNTYYSFRERGIL